MRCAFSMSDFTLHNCSNKLYMSNKIGGVLNES